MLFLCVWLTKAVVRRGIIAPLGGQKGRYDIGSCFVVVDPSVEAPIIAALQFLALRMHT